MRSTVSLQRKWAFTKQAITCPEKMPADWDWVNLPHTWNAIDGQDGGNDYYRGTGWYAKSVARAELPAGDRHYLEVTGANASADVYFNGDLLGHHDGGYSTFRVDLTGHIKDENLLVIAVDNGVSERVYPQSADFTFYGGLYRQVNVIGVPEEHFELMDHGSSGIHVVPDVTGSVEVLTGVCCPDPYEVHVSVRDRDGAVVASGSSDDGRVVLVVDDPHLWQGRRDPYLYEACAELVAGGEVRDAVRARFGFRSFRIDPDGGFFLNGECYPLHGVSRHQDRRDIGSALLPEHHREDMALIEEVGANTIRLAHYEHDQYFYDLCDEAGMVVWAEIPYITRHMPAGRENSLQQMEELVRQCWNHPSIVVWALSNEITASGEMTANLLENHRELNDLCHRLDPTRLTAVAAVSMCPTDSPYLDIPDVVSYNHYFGWYGGDLSDYGAWFDKFHEEHPGVPVGCSEYGCEALDWHTSDPEPGDYTEEYQARYHEEAIRQLFSRPYLWATHVWNMFDFGADGRAEGGEDGFNHKGLVTADRRYKKDAFYAYKAWLSDEPFVHICGKRYRNRVEDVARVSVYSNQPTVELFANGVSLGEKSAPDHFFRFDVPNDGETDLLAVAGECSDSSHLTKVDKFDESYRLSEAGALVNWFDIIQPAGRYSVQDKVSEIRRSSDAARELEGFLNPFVEAMGDGVPAGGVGRALDMLGGFSALRVCNLLNQMLPDDVKLTGEDVLRLNALLNEVERP